MKSFLSILKLFLIDWVLTYAMLFVGAALSFLVTLGASSARKGISKIFNLVNPGQLNMVNTYTYLFINISLVILFCFLINKKYTKYSLSTYFLSQILYVLSFVYTLRLFFF